MKDIAGMTYKFLYGLHGLEKLKQRFRNGVHLFYIKNAAL